MRLQHKILAQAGLRKVPGGTWHACGGGEGGHSGEGEAIRCQAALKPCDVPDLFQTKSIHATHPLLVLPHTPISSLKTKANPQIDCLCSLLAML